MATGFPIIFGEAKRLWTPSQISTALWLDANDASTITLNGSNVSQWSDKSGNARHATQATAANQPTYLASDFSGKPCVSWPGTAAITLNTPAFSIDAGTRAFVVVSVVSSTWQETNFRRIWVSSSGAGYAQGYLGGASAVNRALAVAGSTSTTAPIVTVTGDEMLTVRFGTAGLSSNELGLSANGSAATTTTGNTGTLNQSALIFGQPVGPGGTVAMLQAEHVFISGNVDTTTVQLVEGYLAWKWGTQTKLPANHPYKNSPPTV